MWWPGGRRLKFFVSRYFTKGRMAVVEGRLQIRDWTDKEGGKRRSAEVIADQVYFGTPSGTATAEAIPMPAMRPAAVIPAVMPPPQLPPLPRPPPAMAPPPAATSLPSFLMMTANCRSNFDRIWS